MNFNKALHEELEGCVREGIITSQQQAAIEARAALPKESGRSRGVLWIAAMAGLSFALGLILTISHNWDRIPDLVKISGFLIILIGSAEAALRLHSRPAASTGLAALWFFLPAAGIGLYAQIFQLSGDPTKPFLVWAALSAPLAFWWSNSKIAYLELLLLLLLLWKGSFAEPGIMNITDGVFWNNPSREAPLSAWLLSLATLGAFLALVRS
ncbi:MAG TPA: DUF2157 domain-containing protein, partial [Elusimicrobiales bacterium]|nr:DUF2157 domain-containing protein [Elusimicrobiales bacterium]